MSIERFAARIVMTFTAAALIAGCADETTSPEPVVFSCDNVGQGQSLGGSAMVTGDELAIRITSDNGRFTEAPTVTGVSGGTLDSVTTQDGVAQVAIVGAAGSVSFDLAGRLTGPSGTTCPVEKSITVTVNADGATVN